MLMPALALLAPVVATGVKQYFDHKTDVAKVEATRDGAVVGIVVVGATVVCGFVADWAHHRASLKHLVAALNTAVENDDPDSASELIAEIHDQLQRKTLPHKLVTSAERSIEAAAQRLGSQILTVPRDNDQDVAVVLPAA